MKFYMICSGGAKKWCSFYIVAILYQTEQQKVFRILQNLAHVIISIRF